MASSKTAGAISVLISRLFVFIFLFVSLIVLATNKVTLSDDDGGKTKYTFKNFYAYRYLLSVATIGCAYTLVQIPFAALSVSKGNNNLHPLVIFTDLVFTSLFATGVGAGFGITVDLKSYRDKSARDFGVQDDPEVKATDKFFDLVHVSTGFALMATVCMIVITMISMHALARKLSRPEIGS